MTSGCVLACVHECVCVCVCVCVREREREKKKRERERLERERTSGFEKRVGLTERKMIASVFHRQKKDC